MTLLGYYARQTDRPTSQQTDQQTDIRSQRQFTLPIIDGFNILGHKYEREGPTSPIIRLAEHYAAPSAEDYQVSSVEHYAAPAAADDYQVSANKF